MICPLALSHFLKLSKGFTAPQFVTQKEPWISASFVEIMYDLEESLWSFFNLCNAVGRQCGPNLLDTSESIIRGPLNDPGQLG